MPDTFALLPRAFSDVYFSLDALFNPPEVMCLGGPNLDLKTLSAPALAQRGFSLQEIRLAQAEDCFNKFDKRAFTVNYEKKTNTSWLTAGARRRRRKRRAGGVVRVGVLVEKSVAGLR